MKALRIPVLVFVFFLGVALALVQSSCSVLLLPFCSCPCTCTDAHGNPVVTCLSPPSGESCSDACSDCQGEGSIIPPG